MAKIFISYSHEDSEIAENLATRLIDAGDKVWLDKWELMVGDSILIKISKEIETSDFLIVLLSEKSVSSKWVEEELAQASVILAERGAFILPVLLEDCPIPLILRHRKYANWKDDPDEAFLEITKTLQKYNALKRKKVAKSILDKTFVGWSRKLKSAKKNSEREEIYLMMEKNFTAAFKTLKLPQNLYRLWLDECLKEERYLELNDTIVAFKEVALETKDLKIGQAIVYWLLSLEFVIHPDKS